jgi:hypothetical protein
MPLGQGRELFDEGVFSSLARFLGIAWQGLVVLRRETGNRKTAFCASVRFVRTYHPPRQTGIFHRLLPVVLPFSL